MADPDVPLEAHEDGAVDGGHHGHLDGGQHIGHEVRVGAAGEQRPQLGQRVQAQAAAHHEQVVHRHQLRRLIKARLHYD